MRLPGNVQTEAGFSIPDAPASNWSTPLTCISTSSCTRKLTPSSERPISTRTPHALNCAQTDSPSASALIEWSACKTADLKLARCIHRRLCTLRQHSVTLKRCVTRTFPRLGMAVQCSNIPDGSIGHPPLRPFVARDSALTYVIMDRGSSSGLDRATWTSK